MWKNTKKELRADLILGFSPEVLKLTFWHEVGGFPVGLLINQLLALIAFEAPPKIVLGENA